MATGLWLTLGLLPSPAEAIQLPTTTSLPLLPTIPLPTITLPTVTLPTFLPTTTIALPTTTVTVPTPTGSTTAATSPTATTAPSTASTTPSGSATLPTQPNGASTTTVSSVDGILIPGSTGGSDTSTSFAPPASELEGQTGFGEDGVVPAEPSSAPLWDSVLDFLRPVLPPRIAEILLSPLLVLEVVIRALLNSGSALLIPVAALGIFTGWASWRWAPNVDTSPRNWTAPTGFLDGWIRNDVGDSPRAISRQT